MSAGYRGVKTTALLRSANTTGFPRCYYRALKAYSKMELKRIIQITSRNRVSGRPFYETGMSTSTRRLIPSSPMSTRARQRGSRLTGERSYACFFASDVPRLSSFPLSGMPSKAEEVHNGRGSSLPNPHVLPPLFRADKAGPRLAGLTLVGRHAEYS